MQFGTLFEKDDKGNTFYVYTVKRVSGMTRNVVALCGGDPKSPQTFIDDLSQSCKVVMERNEELRLRWKNPPAPVGSPAEDPRRIERGETEEESLAAIDRALGGEKTVAQRRFRPELCKPCTPRRNPPSAPLPDVGEDCIPY